MRAVKSGLGTALTLAGALGGCADDAEVAFAPARPSSPASTGETVIDEIMPNPVTAADSSGHMHAISPRIQP